MNVVVLRSSFFFVILLFRSVVPQTTVILNSDRQTATVAKMDDPLSNRAPDSLENIISKSVATTPTPAPLTATATAMSPPEDQSTFHAGHGPRFCVVGAVPRPPQGGDSAGETALLRPPPTTTCSHLSV